MPLALGRVDAVLLDLPIAVYNTADDARFKFVGPRVGQGHYGIGLRPTDDDLAAAVDEALSELMRTGRLREIYATWKLWNDDQLTLAAVDRPAEAAGLRNEVQTEIAETRRDAWTFRRYAPPLFAAAGVTVGLTFVSMALAMTIGLIAKRVGTLYVAQLASVMIGFALYAAAAVLLERPELMVPDERHWLMDEPLKALAGIGALTYQTGNFNILPMYVVLLAMLPAIMLLARIRLGLAVAASLALWLAANLFHLTLPAYPAPGGWFFNPLTWQLIRVDAPSPSAAC